MEGRNVKGVLEEMIARGLSWRNDLFRLWSAPACDERLNARAPTRAESRSRTERKSSREGAKIDQKSSQNGVKSSQNRSGRVPGCSGASEKSVRSAPGEPRKAFFRSASLDGLPARFLIELRVNSRGPNVESTRHERYGLHVAPFSSERLRTPENERQLIEKETRTVPRASKIEPGRPSSSAQTHQERTQATASAPRARTNAAGAQRGG